MKRICGFSDPFYISLLVGSIEFSCSHNACIHTHTITKFTHKHKQHTKIQQQQQQNNNILLLTNSSSTITNTFSLYLSRFALFWCCLFVFVAFSLLFILSLCSITFFDSFLIRSQTIYRALAHIELHIHMCTYITCILKAKMHAHIYQEQHIIIIKRSH